MNTTTYIERVEHQRQERMAICAREQQLIEASRPLLDAVEQIDPDAAEKLLDIIGYVALRNPLRLDA